MLKEGLIIGLYTVNHILVTIIRVYLRGRKVRFYNTIRNQEKLKSLKRSIKRRIIKPITFLLSGILTAVEYYFLMF